MLIKGRDRHREGLNRLEPLGRVELSVNNERVKEPCRAVSPACDAMILPDSADEFWRLNDAESVLEFTLICRMTW